METLWALVRNRLDRGSQAVEHIFIGCLDMFWPFFFAAPLFDVPLFGVVTAVSPPSHEGLFCGTFVGVLGRCRSCRGSREVQHVSIGWRDDGFAVCL